VTASSRPGENWAGPYLGADWGFSTDPTVLLKMWVHSKRLYIEHEAFKVGCDIVDTPKLFDTVPGSRKYLIRADCARPETINHVRRAGFHIEAAKKWPKSVEDGIALIRSFEKIVIHPRCKNTITDGTLPVTDCCP
jgi:phage terminase large subunit